jgi:sugar lactone lactonase YvrE
MKITRIEAFRCKLGEGPVWDEEEQALYGTDLLARTIWRYDPVRGEHRCWKFADQVGSFALRDGGGAIVALRSGLYLFDFDTGEHTALGNPCAHDSRLQLNDGKVDPAGRFIVGSVHTSARITAAAVYSVNRELRVQTLDTGFVVTNGPCWSPDGRRFHIADSARNEIYAYDYDMASGAVSGRRVFANTGELGGIPDGATFDADGGLWTAICGAAKVVRFTPDGRISTIVQMPTPLVSSVMFGGRNLDRLFVTSIDPAAAAAEIEMAANTPHRSDENSGAVFIIDGLGVSGLPEARFAGRG